MSGIILPHMLIVYIYIFELVKAYSSWNLIDIWKLIKYFSDSQVKQVSHNNKSMYHTAYMFGHARMGYLCIVMALPFQLTIEIIL